MTDDQPKAPPICPESVALALIIQAYAVTHNHPHTPEQFARENPMLNPRKVALHWEAAAALFEFSDRRALMREIKVTIREAGQ